MRDAAIVDVVFAPVGGVFTQHLRDNGSDDSPMGYHHEPLSDVPGNNMVERLTDAAMEYASRFTARKCGILVCQVLEASRCFWKLLGELYERQALRAAKMHLRQPIVEAKR